MKRLTIAIIVAALAYSGFWFWSASVQKDAIAHWFETRRDAGWTADYSELSVIGFPNRLDTTITSPRLGDPSTGTQWETPFFQILRLSYNPKHLIAVAANEQTFSTANGELGIKTSDLRASLELADIKSLTPERLIVVAEGLDMASTSGFTLKSNVAQISIDATATDETQYRIGIDARGVAGSLPGLMDIAQGNDRAIDRLTLDTQITLTAPLSRTTIENARPQLDKITITQAEILWSGLKLSATGEVEIGHGGTPIGKITLKLENWRAMIASERQDTRITQEALNQIELVLKLISGLSGNPETLDLPFDFVNGQIWLGPLKLGNAPIIAIP
jgi:hypothetical protein